MDTDDIKRTIEKLQNDPYLTSLQKAEFRSRILQEAYEAMNEEAMRKAEMERLKRAYSANIASQCLPHHYSGASGSLSLAEEELKRKILDGMWGDGTNEETVEPDVGLTEALKGLL